MNKFQTEAITQLVKSRKDLSLELKDNSIVVQKNKMSLTSCASIKNSDPISILAFIWSVSGYQRNVITEAYNHKIVVECIKKDGVAQINLAIESKDPVLNYTSIENLLPQEGTVVKRAKTYPRSIKEIVDSRWFNEMRSMIASFNGRCVVA